MSWGKRDTQMLVRIQARIGAPTKRDAILRASRGPGLSGVRSLHTWRTSAMRLRLGQLRLGLGKFASGRSQARTLFGQVCANFHQVSGLIRATLADADQFRSAFDHIRADTDHIWAAFDHIRANFGRLRNWPMLANICRRIWPRRSKLWPIPTLALTDLVDRFWTFFGAYRSHSARMSSVRSNSAQFWPASASFVRLWTEPQLPEQPCRQLEGNLSATYGQLRSSPGLPEVTHRDKEAHVALASEYLYSLCHTRPVQGRRPSHCQSGPPDRDPLQSSTLHVRSFGQRPRAKVTKEVRRWSRSASGGWPGPASEHPSPFCPTIFGQTSTSIGKYNRQTIRSNSIDIGTRFGQFRPIWAHHRRNSARVRPHLAKKPDQTCRQSTRFDVNLTDFGQDWTGIRKH